MVSEGIAGDFAAVHPAARMRANGMKAVNLRMASSGFVFGGSIPEFDIGYPIPL
jgi:hypothetical protein